MHNTTETPPRNGELSYWIAKSDDENPGREGRPNAQGLIEADVCIIGGGYTGLWTAYHLTERHPGLSIVVLEQHRVGFGASGRNAGWLSPLPPGNRRKFARAAGDREASVRMQRRMLDGVDEVLSIIEHEQISASARRSGNVVVARTPAALARLTSRRTTDLSWGLREDEVRMLDTSELAEHLKVGGALGGLFYPTVGRIDPYALAAGLAQVLEGRGVKIFEESWGVEHPSIAGRVDTADARIVAKSVLRCTEGFGSRHPGDPRRLIPVNSSIVITEPLSDAFWAEVGWQGYECLSDAAHVFTYGQRTDDGRILIGGRGSPYRYGSGINEQGRVDASTVSWLSQRLKEMFPALDAPVAHAWSGVLGVTRDWCASVSFDPQRRLGHAHGYAGHGVTSSYLAASSLADLALARTGPDSTMPWVGHQARRWEPEPVRWFGVHAMYRLFSVADAIEERSSSMRTSRVAKLGSHLAGLAE